MPPDFRSENYTPELPDSDEAQSEILETQRETAPDASDGESGDIRDSSVKETEPDIVKVEPVKHNPHFWDNLRKKK